MDFYLLVIGNSMRIPQENIPTTTNVVCSEEEMELELLISETIEQLNRLARGESLADDLATTICQTIREKVDREIECFKDHERWEVIWNEKEIQEAVQRLICQDLIEKLRNIIFPEW